MTSVREEMLQREGKSVEIGEQDVQKKTRQAKEAKKTKHAKMAKIN